MLGLAAAIAGSVTAATGGIACWMGVPIEKGQVGTAPGRLVEWRIRWACWRWIVEIRELAPRTVEWTPWQKTAEVGSKAVAKATALVMAANRLPVPASASAPPKFILSKRVSK